MSQNRAYYLPTMICTNSRCGHFVTTSERLSSYAQWLPPTTKQKNPTIFYRDRGFSILQDLRNYLSIISQSFQKSNVQL